MDMDLKLEKTLDSLLEEMVGEIGMDVAAECPVIRGVYKTKELLRENNNAEIAIELGFKGVCSNAAACERCHEKIAEKAKKNAVLKRAPGGRIRKA